MIAPGDNNTPDKAMRRPLESPGAASLRRAPVDPFV